VTFTTQHLIKPAVVLMLAMAGLTSFANATYPEKPITMVVGYPPGGSTDAAGRAVAEGLAKALKATVTVENIGGAGGVIGAKKLMAAKPDGYTLLVGSNNELAIAPLVSPSARYDALKDMTPLGFVATQPIVLVTSPKTGITSLAQFMDAVKARPGQFSYGTSGVGSALHLTGELVKQKGGLGITHVPYRGVASLLNDVLGGNIEFAFFVQSSILSQIQSGKVVPLAVSEDKRSAQLPQVPSLSEHPSLKGAAISSWFMLMAPRHLPEPVHKTLTAGFAALLQDPAFRKRLEATGSRVATGDEKAGDILQAEVAAYRGIVTTANIKLDE